MIAQEREGDEGFIVLDAVMATALVALAGTTITIIALQMLRQQDAALGRSVALVMSQSLMHQYLLLGGAGGFEEGDEHFSYRVFRGGRAPKGTVLLETVAIVAEPKASGDPAWAEKIEFLAPTASAPP
jgi:hypothetical protein